MNRLVLLLLAACAVPGAPPPSLSSDWIRVHAERGADTFHHSSGGTIASHATCGESADDVPLDVLTNHLLFGVEKKREHSRVLIKVGGRAAMRTRLDGQIDGVNVALDVVVLNKDGCTYDLMLITPPAVSASREPDFDHVVATFAPERSR